VEEQRAQWFQQRKRCSGRIASKSIGAKSVDRGTENELFCVHCFDENGLQRCGRGTFQQFPRAVRDKPVLWLSRDGPRLNHF